MLYLGIDLHRKQMTVSLRNHRGDVLLRRQVSTRWPKLEEFREQLQQAAADDEKYVADAEHGRTLAAGKSRLGDAVGGQRLSAGSSAAGQANCAVSSGGERGRARRFRTGSSSLSAGEEVT